MMIPTNPWPHRFAIVLLWATFPLIWVGGLVTTYDAGMAVRDWPTTYGYNLFLYPLSEWWYGPFDLFVEHGHRLLGAMVGLLTILFVLAVWKWDGRRWLKALAVVALLAVVAQGTLGGLRVILDSTLVARIHGCTAPLFFSLCVVLAASTSRWWTQPVVGNEGGRAVRGSHDPALSRWWTEPVAGNEGPMRKDSSRAWQDPYPVPMAWLLAGMTYLQLVVGAHIRHVTVTTTPQQFRAYVLTHLLLALALLLVAFTFLGRVMRHWRRVRLAGVVAPAFALMAFLLVQVALGAASWVQKFGGPTWLPAATWSEGFTISAEAFWPGVIVTAHVATGSLILALAVYVALRGARYTAEWNRAGRAASEVAVMETWSRTCARRGSPDSARRGSPDSAGTGRTGFQPVLRSERIVREVGS